MYVLWKKHQRKFCSAKEVICFYCSKKENFSKVCHSENGTTKRLNVSLLLGLKADCYNLIHSKVNRKVTINGIEANDLTNSSTRSHLSKWFFKLINLELQKSGC